MEINNIYGIGGQIPYGSQTKESTFGKEDFLKILVAQLQNQDPLSPMNDTEFIAQMTQFSMAEEISKINSGFDFLKGVSLTGKNILAKVSNAYYTEYVEGTVEKVSIEKGQVYAVVNDKRIKISDILEVYE
ncbi:MAG: flagellar hook capping FlgD N-terminal domain-containing protein [Clostridia bacterium]|jgi:flagellar basal-body rod modification protein FlgD|nr:hypothetical protein [Clostridiaceae bacterium]